MSSSYQVMFFTLTFCHHTILIFIVVITQVSESLAARSERLLAAAAIAERAGAGVGRSPPTKGQGLLARAGLRRKPFGSAGSITGGDGGGTSGGDPGGPWEALDEVVKEAVREAFAAADKEFIATSRLPEVGALIV